MDATPFNSGNVRLLVVALFLMTASVFAENENPPESLSPVGNQVQKWAKAADGTNLAAQKSVWFSRNPNYRRFSKTGHNRKLTDGILSPRADGEIWFSEETVGWSSWADAGIDLWIDLESEQPIDRVVVRFLGGGKQGSMNYPKKVSVLLSNDGITFHQSASRLKVADGEKELAEFDPNSYFYFAETGTAFVEPVSLPVRASARYVVLRIVGESGWMFLDELSVVKSTASSSSLANIDSFPTQSFIKEGIRIAPRANELVITSNLATPNFLMVQDFREEGKGVGETYKLLIDLPEGVTLLRENPSLERLSSKETGRVQFRVESKPTKYGLTGAFYFGMEKGTVLPNKAEARFSWADGETLKNTVTVPIKMIEIPAVPASVASLNACLAWMTGTQIEAWPDFFETYRQMGFSIVPIFPSHDLTGAQSLAEKARTEGFRVAMNDSAFHRLKGRRGNKPEIFNTVKGEPGKYLCPVYVGEYYREEIERVATFARGCMPDFIIYDIELWNVGSDEAKKCDRCLAEFKQSGGADWNQFIVQQGTRMMKDLREATAGSAPKGGNPVIGLYNNKRVPPIYHGVFDFRELYPKWVDVAQPSLYVQGDSNRVGNSVRENYELLKNRSIVPWLTAGTYGHFPPHKLEQMVLEAYLNGACGINYYSFRDFDPMTLYFHASALSKLAPFANLLSEGVPVEVTSSNKALRCSAFGNEREALVLVGNYQGVSEQKGELRFSREPFQFTEVDGSLDRKIADHRQIGIPPGGHRLYHVVFME